LSAFAVLFVFGCSAKKPITYTSRVKTVKSLPTLKLHYIEEGSGDDLLMLHGFGSSSSTFKKIIPTLSKRYHIWALDLKGFGKSPKPDDDNYSVYDQYLLIKAFIKDHQIKNPIILGHSIGGSIALLLAMDQDIKVKKLILLDTPAYKQRLPRLLRYVKTPIFGKLGFYILPSSYEVKEGYRYAFYDDKKIPKDMVKELSKNLQSKGAKRAFVKTNDELIPDDIDDLIKRYKEIKIPTLIVWGYEDEVVLRSKAYRLNKDIKDSRLRFVYDCGHIPQEEQPEELIKILDKFL
jgi:pimeloyl-ACP methyl ester carboxylesterase